MMNQIQKEKNGKRLVRKVLILAVLITFALVFTMGCNPVKASEEMVAADAIEVGKEVQTDEAEEEPTDEAVKEATDKQEDENVENPADEQGETAETESWAETWAQAFCGRDGKTISEMSGEAVQKQLEEEMLLDGNSFGWSSPWPWPWEGKTDYYMVVEETDSEAVILYYAWVSDPHVTVWRETLTAHYSGTDGKVSVEAEQLTYMEDIDTYEEYMQAYPNGIAGTPMDYVTNGAGESIRQQTETAEVSNDYFAQFFLPETAAVTQLNLSEESEKVQVETGESEEDGSVPLKIIFTESGDEVSLHMIQPYGENGIWVVK